MKGRWSPRNQNIVSTRNYFSGGWFDSLGNLLILTNCKYFRRLHTSFCDRFYCLLWTDFFENCHIKGNIILLLPGKSRKKYYFEKAKWFKLFSQSAFLGMWIDQPCGGKCPACVDSRACTESKEHTQPRVGQVPQSTGWSFIFMWIRNKNEPKGTQCTQYHSLLLIVGQGNKWRVECKGGIVALNSDWTEIVQQMKFSEASWELKYGFTWEASSQSKL